MGSLQPSENARIAKLEFNMRPNSPPDSGTDKIAKFGSKNWAIFALFFQVRSGLLHGDPPRDRHALRLQRLQQDRPPEGRLPEQARDHPRPRVVSQYFKIRELGFGSEHDIST